MNTNVSAGSTDPPGGEKQNEEQKDSQNTTIGHWRYAHAPYWNK